MLVLLLVKCKHGMRWAKCSLFIARKFVRTVYLRGWLRCPINLPVNIWKVRWNVNTLLGSTVHNKNKTVMDAGSWGLVVSIRWFQPMRVRTRFLFLVASIWVHRAGIWGWFHTTLRFWTTARFRFSASSVDLKQTFRSRGSSPLSSLRRSLHQIRHKLP